MREIRIDDAGELEVDFYLRGVDRLALPLFLVANLIARARDDGAHLLALLLLALGQRGQPLRLIGQDELRKEVALCCLGLLELFGPAFRADDVFGLAV